MILHGTFKARNFQQIDSVRFDLPIAGFAVTQGKEGGSCHEVTGIVRLNREEMEKLASQIDTLLARP